MARKRPDPAIVAAMRRMGRMRWQAWSQIAARPSQLPHPSKPYSLYIGGRGSGKTRAGSEVLAHAICTEPGTYALGVPTLDHGITECLEEGIYQIIPEEFRHWRGSVNQVDFDNGSRLRLVHAMQPGKARGPNLKGFWLDEPAEMRFGMDAWANLQFANRIERSDGKPPWVFVTGTPKRVELMLHLDKLVKERSHAYSQSHGTMRDNIRNLSAETVEELIALYEGTNLGLQELEGIMVEDVDGALLDSVTIHKHRQDNYNPNPAIRVMAIDPGFGANPLADEVGIAIGQRIGSGPHAIGEFLDDASRRGTPGSWSEYLPLKCDEWNVDVIAYEGNFIGQWLKETMLPHLANCQRMPRLESITSNKSKWARAEPVAALASKGRYRMIGTHARLEAELCTWVPDTGMRSPNRLDAWAHLGRYMLIKGGGPGSVGKKPAKRIGSVV